MRLCGQVRIIRMIFKSFIDGNGRGLSRSDNFSVSCDCADKFRFYSEIKHSFFIRVMFGVYSSSGLHNRIKKLSIKVPKDAQTRLIINLGNRKIILYLKFPEHFTGVDVYAYSSEHRNKNQFIPVNNRPFRSQVRIAF